MILILKIYPKIFFVVFKLFKFPTFNLRPVLSFLSLIRVDRIKVPPKNVKLHRFGLIFYTIGFQGWAFFVQFDRALILHFGGLMEVDSSHSNWAE